MNSLLDKFYFLLEKVTNLIILNFVFLLFCLPIFTIFPAITAMFGVIREWTLNKDNSILKKFIKQFKLHFKQSFLIGLIWSVSLAFLYMDYYLILQIQSSWKAILLVPLLLVSFIFIFMTLYLFSVIVHYKLNTLSTMKRSFIISLAFFPKTLLLIGIATLLFSLLFFVPIIIIIGISIWAFINFWFCNQSFKKIKNVSS